MSKLPQTIVITGRRWFDAKNGNTYHTARAVVDGKLELMTDREYGYGDQYLWTAWEQLQEMGIVPTKKRSDSPWRWCEDNGVKLEYSAVDVARKKDL